MYAPACPSSPAFAAATPVFDAAETAAVRLGAVDPLSSIESTRSRLARWLFGDRRLPLANDRLEALRRLAVQLRHAQTPSPHQLSAARDAGVSDLQLHMLWTLFRAGGPGRCAA